MSITLSAAVPTETAKHGLIKTANILLFQPAIDFYGVNQPSPLIDILVLERVLSSWLPYRLDIFQQLEVRDYLVPNVKLY